MPPIVSRDTMTVSPRHRQNDEPIRDVESTDAYPAPSLESKRDECHSRVAGMTTRLWSEHTSGMRPFSGGSHEHVCDDI